MERIIFHVDMDAFYASVEQRDEPRYRGRPLIVGADPRGGRGRGVVAACSYEARRFGVHSAQPISQAYRRCPRAVFLRPDMERYARTSRRLLAIFGTFSPRVEPVSIDEAFLDMSGEAAGWQEALELARRLKETIRSREHLTCSVGIAPGKMVAKIASDLKKPDGLVLVTPDEVQSFLDPLPISAIWGVGPRTAERLAELGMETILQLRHVRQEDLERRFGKAGSHLWRLANGIDERPVLVQRERKSVSRETTFSHDVASRDTLDQTLARLSRKVAERLRKRGLAGHTLTLKVRYSDFTTITRSRTVGHLLCQQEEICRVAAALLEKNLEPARRVRLLGVGISKLEELSPGRRRQLSLF